MSKDMTKTLHTLDKIVAKIVEDRDAEIARLTAELAAAHRIIAEQRTWLGSGEAAKSQPRTDTGAIVADVLACAEAWAPEARVIGNVRADEIAAMCHELAAARAVTAGVCRYLDCAASDLLAVVTSLYETRARAISDATAARGTVGGLLATAPECPTWCATHDPRDMATAMDGDRRYASPECRDAGRCLTRGPLPKGG